MSTTSGALHAGNVIDALARRGPDGSGVETFTGGNAEWTLVHTRLAINDLTDAGAQPMNSASGRYCMVFNGEIYNYPELRALCEARGRRLMSRMDGEVILHLLEMEGTDAFARLNGIFAIAVADRLAEEVLLVRDPLGVKPLFYAFGQGGELRFASELRALHATGADLRGYDVVGLAQFLTFLWVPAPRTPFRGASSLLPGELLTWSPRGSRRTTYRSVYSALEEPAAVADPREVVEAARSALDAAVRRQLLSDVPVGLMASGGIDSGLVWATASDRLAAAFTVTWGEARHDDDWARVRSLHARWPLALVEVPGPELALDVLPASGDLVADPAFMLAEAIAGCARARGVPVLLSGQGGDELFGGYRRHVVARLLGPMSVGRTPARSAISLLSRLAPRNVSAEYVARLLDAVSRRDPFAGYLGLSTYSSAEERAIALECTAAEVSDEMVWSSHREFYDSLPTRLPFTRKAMALDLGVYLPGLGLAYNDRAGMQHGIEVRVPWLDLDLVQWSLTVPVAQLFRRAHGKQVTRALAERAIGSGFAQAPKRGFGAPQDSVRALDPGSGGEGFRQVAYFRYAAKLLDGYRQSTGAQLLTAPAPAARG